MATICKPSVVLPQYAVNQEEIISVLKRVFTEYADWPRVENMIRNTQVENRRLIRPINEVVEFKGFEQRNTLYEQEALKLSAEAVQLALEYAGIRATDVHLIIALTCTGFMMPPISSYLINRLGFSPYTKQLPIAQLGCVAGASAVNRAFEYLSLKPKENVLILSTEFSSLCFQRSEESVSSFVSNAIFGDCVTACIVKGDDDNAEGYKIVAGGSYLLKDSEHFIKYAVKDSGFHFMLDKEVMYSIRKVAPVLQNFLQTSLHRDPKDLDFYIFHTGGRRILDELAANLSLDKQGMRFSRQSLQTVGNIASGVVFDVLHRQFESGERNKKDLGLMAAFGPGFTSEYNAGIWNI